MISKSRGFIFVHVPKTGGNSLQNYLRDFSDDEIVCTQAHQDGVERFEILNRQYGFTKHATLAQYKDKLPAEEYSRAFRFCCVRDPWERAVSFYFSPHRQVRTWSRSDFIAFVREVPPMTHYLRETAEQRLSDIAANFSQVLRFETLEADFDGVCDRLGLPRRKLPHRNKSVRSPSQSYYDEETVALVGDLFREDIELFGYKAPEIGSQHG